MNYDLSARIFPFLFDKCAYSFFRTQGLTLSKKKIHKCYKAMILRTPSLGKDNSFVGNILMGCYALSFYQTYPDLINEDMFHQLVLALCFSKPMVNAHKKEDAFDEEMLRRKEKEAVHSKESPYEMDWQYTLERRKDSYDLTYTKCGLCQLGKRENCFHLIKHLCEADFITYRLMKADLRRTKTIANGDDYCDFHVLRKEN